MLSILKSEKFLFKNVQLGSAGFTQGSLKDPLIMDPQGPVTIIIAKA